MPAENIIRFFKKCCFSNKFDGIEDDALLLTYNESVLLKLHINKTGSTGCHKNIDLGFIS